MVFFVPFRVGRVVAGVEAVDKAGVGGRGWEVLQSLLVGSGGACCDSLGGGGADVIETGHDFGVPADRGPEGKGDVAVRTEDAVAFGEAARGLSADGRAEGAEDMGEGVVGEGEMHHVAFPGDVVHPTVAVGGRISGFEHLGARVGEDKGAGGEDAGGTFAEGFKQSLGVMGGYCCTAGKVEHVNRCRRGWELLECMEGEGTGGGFDEVVDFRYSFLLEDCMSCFDAV